MTVVVSVVGAAVLVAVVVVTAAAVAVAAEVAVVRGEAAMVVDMVMAAVAVPELVVLQNVAKRCNEIQSLRKRLIGAATYASSSPTLCDEVGTVLSISRRRLNHGICTC